MPEELKCPACGAPYQVGASTCPACGVRLMITPLSADASADASHSTGSQPTSASAGSPAGSPPAGTEENLFASTPAISPLSPPDSTNANPAPTEDDYFSPPPPSAAQNQTADEFAALDYQPRPKKKLLLPLLLISLAALALACALIFLFSETSTDKKDETIVTLPEQGADEAALPEEDITEEPEGATEQNGSDEAGDAALESPPLEPPDFERLEPDLHNWLIERTGDGNVILLPAAALDDTERFFERFDLATDHIIVYRLEATSEEYATVFLGQPYSEWSLKAVFLWKDDGWHFLREEPLKP